MTSNHHLWQVVCSRDSLALSHITAECMLCTFGTWGHSFSGTVAISTGGADGLLVWSEPGSEISVPAARLPVNSVEALSRGVRPPATFDRTTATSKRKRPQKIFIGL